MTRTAAIAVLACALVLPVAVTAPSHAVPEAPAGSVAATAPPTGATSSTALELPRPTGKFAVGSSVHHLADRSRKDPWEPAADARELMATVHYPAARPARPGARTTAYGTVAEARALLKGIGLDAAVPAERLAATRTHSRPGAPPARGKFPLVVLSPGFSVPRYTLTSIAEDLASRGYVTVSVDHAYESYGLSVPGGRLLTCKACTALDVDGVPASVVTTTRAKDVSYVLDRLTGRHSVWKHSGMIDRGRIGMAGHSIGGASAATAMVNDRRVLAGINMDGAFWEDLPPSGLDGRPFMMLGTDDEVHRPGGLDTTWDRIWPSLDGWKRWLTVTGTDHGSFSDFPLIEAHFGVPLEPLPAQRSVALVRGYVAAFFDEHLKRKPQPLLAGPSAADPEVNFHHLP
ncbi:alpha/beta hydrolase [Streptomyces qinzhouensis]|uniref:Alpha/beta hydrolase n=1 Tax=Streptomyces qinzhouensis TaxID=2599401 RepID=A0A5B8IQA1_9ACTN|nr:alpha/beta hydrolase [Streptomyces qinzhouensis]